MNNKSREIFLSIILIEVSNKLQGDKFNKFNYSDVKGYLTDADLFVDEYIKNNIKKNFPDDLIYSEESDSNFLSFNDEYIWILDPICGTTNFIKGIPFFVHSISVADKNGVKFSGIFDPNRKELFTANENETKLNGEIVNVSNTKILSDCIVAINTNQSAWMDESILKIEKLVSILAPPVTRRIKIFESANLELAYVACGRLDAYICLTDKVWDMAAGCLMIQSSGGICRAIEGSLAPLDLNSLGVIASNSFVFKDIIYRIKNHA